MKKLLLVLSMTALGVASASWAKQTDTIRHDCAGKPALTQPVAHKDKSAARKEAEQCQVQEQADHYPFTFIPLSSTEPDDPLDQREGGAIC